MFARGRIRNGQVWTYSIDDPRSGALIAFFEYILNQL